MNIKTFSLLLVMAAFLAGAFLSVLDPTEVNWPWMLAVLAVGAVALTLYRRAHHAEASAEHKVSGHFGTLKTSLDHIVENLEALNRGAEELPVHEARFEIDRRFRDDLNRFVEARESMIHVFGLQPYADVMSAFAAGERYVNRVWTASVDGYVDEVRMYLGKAEKQFKEAQALFDQLASEHVPDAVPGTA